MLKLESILKSERGLNGASGSDEVGTQSLFVQNVELRQRLAEAQSNYKHKLQGFQDNQLRQAQLVQKLNAKVDPITTKNV